MSGADKSGPGSLYARVIRDFAHATLGEGSAAMAASVVPVPVGQQSGRPNGEALLVAKVLDAWVRRLLVLESLDIDTLTASGNVTSYAAASHAHSGKTGAPALSSRHSADPRPLRKRQFAPLSAMQQRLAAKGREGKPLEKFPGKVDVSTPLTRREPSQISFVNLVAKRSLPQISTQRQRVFMPSSQMPSSQIHESFPSTPSGNIQTSPQKIDASENYSSDSSDMSESEWVESTRSHDDSECSQLDLNFGGRDARRKRKAKRRRRRLPQPQPVQSNIVNQRKRSKASIRADASGAAAASSASAASSSVGARAPKASRMADKKSEDRALDFQIPFGALSADVQAGSGMEDLLKDDSISDAGLYPNDITLCNDRGASCGSYHRIVGQILSSSRRGPSQSAASSSCDTATEGAAIMMAEQDKEEETHLLVLGNAIASMGSAATATAGSGGNHDVTVPRERFFRRLVCRLRW